MAVARYRSDVIYLANVLAAGYEERVNDARMM